MRLLRLARAGEGAFYGVLTVLGLAFAVGSFGYGIFADGGRVGPGFLPLLAGTALAVLAGVLLRRSLRGTPTEPEPAAVAGTGGAEVAADTADGGADSGIDIYGRSEPQRVRMLWTVFGLTFVALLLVPILGFLISMGLLALVLSCVVERRPFVPALLIAAASVAAVHLIFGQFLEVPLPGGLLGFGTEG